MADIFLSYSRKDAELVRPLVERFRRAGWTVFQDIHTPTGKRWREVIEKQLDESGCVVAAWTKRSVCSEWVLKEVKVARRQRKLISVRFDSTKPPSPYGEVQAADLTHWNGDGVTDAERELFDVIAVTLGKRKGVSVRPVPDSRSQGLVVVLGCPTTHPNLGATVNMTCGFTNELDRDATVHQLVASIIEEKGNVSYSMNWSLLYDVEGGGSDHIRCFEKENILRIPSAAWSFSDRPFLMGVQFRAPTLMQKVSWPMGNFQVRIRGWVNREEDKESNLACSFDAELGVLETWEIEKHQRMSPEEWRQPEYSDNAYGVPFQISNVILGLPAA